MSAHDPFKQGKSIVHALGGQWHDAGGLCRCPAHADRTPSLSVRVGERSLLFHCFAGCDNRDVIAALRLSSLLGRGLAAAEIPVPSLSRRRQCEPAFLLKLWNQCVPVAGTPAERYLASRAITTTSGELRFAPAARIGSGDIVWTGPAMVAAVRDGSGLVALQRTFLAPDGLDKAAIDQPRRMLGTPGSGAVRLSHPGRILGLAEGIETALSASQILGIPVWACLSTRRLDQIALPESIEELVVLADNDNSGRDAAGKAIAAYTRSDLALRRCWPPDGLNDWNDLARTRREEGARKRCP